MSDFTLTHGDRTQPVWAKLVTHLKAELADLRSQNDGDHPDSVTANLRGRIAQIKQIVDLDADGPNRVGL